MKFLNSHYNPRTKKAQLVFNKKIDKDIQSIFFPLNLFHNIMLCPKYSIRNNFIYPNSAKFKLLGLFAAFLYSAILAYRTYKYHTLEIMQSHFNFAYISTYFDILFYTYGHFMNFVLSVLKTKRNISFVLKYQKVHRFFNTSAHFPSLSLWNWIGVLFVITWYVFMFYVNVTFNVHLYVIIIHIITLIFDLNIIYAIRLITLLKYNVNLMNIEIKKLSHTQVDQEHCTKLWKAYENLLNCYDYYNSSFQQPVSIICKMVWD